jgi:hypothetical protein
MSTDEDLDAAPAPLDPSRYVRPRRPLGVREIDGLPVRVVDRLPEPTIRDAVAWTVDMLPAS